MRSHAQRGNKRGNNVLLFCVFVNADVLCMTNAVALAVNAADYGAIPDDGKNDAEALRAAVATCRDEPGSTLLIPSGTYQFRDEKAVEIMDKAMHGEYGNNPEPILMSRTFPHVTGFDFSGAKNITVDANGVTIIFDGWYQPGLHKHVLIEGNQIIGFNAKRGIYAGGVEDLIIRDNQFYGCDIPIYVEYSTGVNVYDNHGTEAVFGPCVTTVK